MFPENSATDPGHLDPGDQEEIEKLRIAVKEGAPIDTVVRAVMVDDMPDGTIEPLIHGAILQASDIDMTEPGYKEKLYPRIESVEVHRGIEKLARAKYGDTMVALADGKMWTPDMEGQRGMIRPPSLEEVVAILSSKLTREQIEFALERMKKPELLFKALTGFGRSRQMLDTGTRLSGDGWEQKDTFVSGNREKKFAEEDREMNFNDQRIAGWKVGIGEGAELDPQTGILRDLLTQWDAELPEGVVLASPKEKVLLMKLGIMRGKPIDERTWSPLRSDKNGKVIGEDELVSYGRWLDARPNFVGGDPASQYGGAVCRPVVMEV